MFFYFLNKQYSPSLFIFHPSSIITYPVKTRYLCFSLILTDDGSVYSCGWGADGQTGLEHFNNCSEFTKVNGDIQNEKIIKLSSRSDFVLALNGK